MVSEFLRTKIAVCNVKPKPPYPWPLKGKAGAPSFFYLTPL
jgi:hypothetical protein